MANGYLGKISAIVSANTADFDGKLSKSAKEVSSFARSVQSNLTSASRQAARSLEGIYTPLQRFERSLQAAASMKLSFKGFPGMIRDLDGLQQRLNSALSKRQVDIVLKTTGMSSVSALRDAISGLKSKDIEIITRLGGLDKVRELRNQIASSQPVIDVRAEVDSAKAKIASVGSQLEAARKAGGSIAVGVDTAEIDRLTVKLAGATAALAGLRKQSSASGGGASGLEKIIAGIDELTTRRARLETKALRIRGDERELQSVNRQIDAISKKIESLETRRAKLSVSTEDFTSKIESAQKLVDRLTAKLDKAKAGGATSDVKELEQQLAAAERQAAKLERKLAQTIKVNVGVDADLGELDAVIENANRAGIVLGKLPALMDALGRSDFTAASDKMRQLQSAATGIGEPLAASVQKLRGLGADMAAAFQPALVSAQRATELIASTIDRQGSASGNLQDRTLESYYESVRQKVERTIASIERLGQVSAQIGQLKTGREFVFEQPRLNEAINRGGDIGNRAAALPAEALRTNPAIAQSLVEIRRLSDEAGVAYAKFLAVKDQKQPTGEAQKELDAVVKKLLEAQAVAEKQIKVALDTAEADAKATALKAKIVALKQDVAFTVTGKVQNFDQARGEVSRLQADLGKLDASQRAPIARKVVALGKLVEAGDVNSLETVRNLIQQIEKAVGRKLRINLEKEQAQRAAQELSASLAKFRESISFTVTGRVQNVEQARSELGRLQSDVDKLTESQKIAIEPRLQALGELVAGNQITDLEQVRKLIAEIAAQAGSGIQINLDTAEADAKATALKGRLDALRQEVRFNVTGSFANADQIEAEVSRVTADIQKLEATQKAAFGQRAMLVIDLLGANKIQEAGVAVASLRAELDQQLEINVTTASAQKAVDDLKAKMAQAREQTAFLVTGRPQNIGQADSRRASIDADVATLGRSQRQNVKPLLEAADAARATGDIDKINDALDDLALKVAQEKRYNVDFEKAKKDSLDLKATMDSLKDESNFAISAYVQNPGQAESEIKRIIGGLEKLDDAQRRALQTDVNSAIASLGKTDAKTGLPDIAAIQVAVSNLKYYFDKELVIKVEKDAAQKSVDDLKASLASIADKIGDPSQPIDRLRQSVEAANAAIAKMPAGAIRAKLEADLNSEKAGLETMSGPAAPRPPDADIDAAAARAKAIAAAATAATPAKAAANPLGADFGTAERSIASLQSNVSSLQSSLEKLPMPMQAQFIPAINKVRDAFQKITTSSTAAEIEAVTKKAAGLERAFARAGQAAKFGGTIGDALNAAAITKTERQLGFIRSKLLEVGATASGPVANAFNAYSAAAAAAAKAGTSGTAKTKQELDGLIAKIGEALVAEGKLTAAQGRAFSKSVGDVGRAGADKFSLAINQAAFAVDDFLSSTGGLEFKLRAISNNITQLGFVIGGTAGLVTGLTAVIAGQAAIQLIKWANNGQSAEDQTKALNEALARQKSLVEDLVQAFKSLGDALSRGTFSAAGEQAQEFSRQLEEIKKKQAESRERTVIDINPEVQRERANQNKLSKQLESETNIGSRTAIQAQIRASEEKERNLGKNAVANTPASAREVFSAILRARDVVEFDRQGKTNAAPLRFTPEEIGRRRQEAVEGVLVDEGRGLGRQTPGSLSDQRRALQKQIADLAEDATGFGPEAARATEQRNNLEVLLASIELPLRKALDDLAISIAEASRGPAEQIRQSQEEVAEAIKLGLPGARLFQQELDTNAKKLADATKKLEMARAGRNAEGNQLTIDEKEARTQEAQDEINALNALRGEIASQTDELRYERTVDPQRQIDARMGRARSNLGAAGLEDGRIARRMREIENERAAIQRQSTLPEFQNPLAQGALQKREQALTAEAAAIEAATIAIKAFAAALDQASQESKSNLNAAQQAADEARRADLGNSTPQTREARQRAEADLQRQREAEQKVQAEIAVARDRLEKQQKPDADRMRQIDEELKGGRNPADDAKKQLADARTAMAADVNSNNSAAAEDVNNARQRDEAARAAAQVTRDIFKAAEGFGIDTTGMDTGQAKEAMRAAGRGEVADELENREAQSNFAMLDAGFDRDARGAGFWDAIKDAGEELAAALARQAQVANEGATKLAEMDAQIAAIPAGDGREELIRERAALSAKMSERALDFQKEIDAAGLDASSREEEQRKAAARGLDLARTPSEKFAEETNRGLADIQAFFQRRTDQNKGVRIAGDAQAQAAAEERFRKEREKEARTATSEGRGAELGMTELARFARDFKEGAGKDIRARAGQLQTATGERPTGFINEALKQQMEQVAPMLASFRDERANADFQGPSRKALQMSDVTTGAGQTELNRLLRGDDASKDVNLVELQKQTAKLQLLIDTVKGSPLPVVN